MHPEIAGVKTVATGSGLTKTLRLTALLVHPFKVYVTLIEVVLGGVNTAVCGPGPPGDHVNVPPAWLGTAVIVAC